MTKIRRSGTVALVLALTSPLAAHDTWILATPGAGARPALRLDVTSGMAFPALESGIRPERVTRAMLRLAGTSQPLPAPLPTKESLRYSLRLEKDGVATLWLQLAPRALDLDPKLIDEYLRENGSDWESDFTTLTVLMAQPSARR